LTLETLDQAQSARAKSEGVEVEMSKTKDNTPIQTLKGDVIIVFFVGIFIALFMSAMMYELLIDMSAFIKGLGVAIGMIPLGAMVNKIINSEGDIVMKILSVVGLLGSFTSFFLSTIDMSSLFIPIGIAFFVIGMIPLAKLNISFNSMKVRYENSEINLKRGDNFADNNYSNDWYIRSLEHSHGEFKTHA
jgi:hypothetical protein